MLWVIGTHSPKRILKSNKPLAFFSFYKIGLFPNLTFEQTFPSAGLIHIKMEMCNKGRSEFAIKCKEPVFSPFSTQLYNHMEQWLYFFTVVPPGRDSDCLNTASFGMFASVWMFGSSLKMHFCLPLRDCFVRSRVRFPLWSESCTDVNKVAKKIDSQEKLQGPSGQ